ncbi:SDR family oxidoreductase [Pseudonocardia alaniniphila]|uniref:SDR family oxidoreductase n=1 Tax=Pseudonocardia alaniniphila TaxID=75291 RepID=A0ABS9TB88_9PSEU|nr:SDR family oxidoreductase [Pseudonocardia alaniniphila]
MTGVSRRIGIGAAIARRLAATGTSLFLHSWEPHDADQPWGADSNGAELLVEELTATGARVEHAAADFSEPTAPASILNQAVGVFGHIDILVANHARSSRQNLDQLTCEEIDLSYAVNTRASMLLVKEFARQHSGVTPGRVILMTSGQHRGPIPDELPYIASKGALHQLTISLAAHLAPRNITVNTIDPGATDTGYADDQLRREVIAHEPMGRWGEPDDAARLVSWLTGPDASWVTGQVIVSSGGGP